MREYAIFPESKFAASIHLRHFIYQATSFVQQLKMEARKKLDSNLNSGSNQTKHKEKHKTEKPEIESSKDAATVVPQEPLRTNPVSSKRKFMTKTFSKSNLLKKTKTKSLGLSHRDLSLVMDTNIEWLTFFKKSSGKDGGSPTAKSDANEDTVTDDEEYLSFDKKKQIDRKRRKKKKRTSTKHQNLENSEKQETPTEHEVGVIYGTRSKLTFDWATMEDEIKERTEQESSDNTERWNSYNKHATSRSNRARKLMSSVPSSIRERSPRKIMRMDTIHTLLENHKNAVKSTTVCFDSDEDDYHDPLADNEPAKDKKNRLRATAPKSRKLLSPRSTASMSTEIPIRIRSHTDTKRNKSYQPSFEVSTEEEEKSPKKPNDRRHKLSASTNAEYFGLKETSRTRSIPKSKKRKHHHFKWKKKSTPSFEADLLERGRTMLNDIRIESNPYQNRRDFVVSIQSESTLFQSIPSLANGSLEDMFYSLFEEEDKPSLIQFEDEETKSQIKSCAILKLLQHLLHYTNTPDFHLISVFLLTYRCFLTPEELMELLIYRAFGRPTAQTEWDNWVVKSKSMHNKVNQFLCNWVDNCFAYDFQDRPRMMYMLAHFAYFLDSMLILKNLLLRTVGSRCNNQFITFFGKKKSLKPLIPSKNYKANISLEDLNPTEIAGQLALVEFDIFCSISPSEFAHQNWCNTGEKEKLAPNILRMISQFNSISNWVASEILRFSTAKQRAIIINRFIIIAEESRALRNFNAVMAILSGLQSTPIYRLKQSWGLLPERSWDIWDKLNGVLANEHNYQSYRNVLRSSKPPRVPYIGVYLTDLVAIEEAHSDYLYNNLINLTKLNFIGSVLFVLEGCKKGKYEITPIPALQACLLATPSVSEEEQRNMSLLLEPVT